MPIRVPICFFEQKLRTPGTQLFRRFRTPKDHGDKGDRFILTLIESYIDLSSYRFRVFFSNGVAPLQENKQRTQRGNDLWICRSVLNPLGMKRLQEKVFCIQPQSGAGIQPGVSTPGKIHINTDSSSEGAQDEPYVAPRQTDRMFKRLAVRR